MSALRNATFLTLILASSSNMSAGGLLSSSVGSATGINMSRIESSMGNLDSVLGTLGLGSLDSYLKSGSSLFQSNINCPGLRTNMPSIGFNLDSILSRLNGSIAGCRIVANQNNLNCLSRKIGNNINTAELLPQTFITRGLRQKINNQDCAQSSSSVGITPVISAGMTPFQRSGKTYRECLNNGGTDCLKSAFTLPSDLDSYEKSEAEGSKILTAENGDQFSGAKVKEKTLRTTVLNSCTTSQCAANSISNQDLDYEKDIAETISKTTSGIAVAINEATSPRFYPYDATEASKNLYPIQYKAKFNGVSIAAMNADALEKMLSFESYQIRKEIYQSLNTQIKAASMPVISKEAMEYAQEVADAR